MSIEVLNSAEFIAANSEFAFVHADNVPAAAAKIYESMQRLGYSTEHWSSHALTPKEKDQRTVDWIFFVDLLNFSFFPEEGDARPRFGVTVQNITHTGYWSLPAVIERARSVHGVTLTDPAFYSAASEEALQHLFRPDEGRAPIPLLSERIRSIKEAGAVLMEKFGGTFANMVKKADHSSQTLLDIVLVHFPTFRDFGTYRERKVAFLKRAQILVADIWACFNGKEYGKFDDINLVTMFADYRVPQALNFYGLLRYSDSLAAILKEERYLENGSVEEMEIRGCSIWAVELLRREIVRKIAESSSINSTTKDTTSLNVKADQINAIIIDFYLWDFAKEQEASTLGLVPWHRTRCIYY